MMYALFGMSLLFIVIGYLVTENNAQYLLSGYNTMSKEERENFDIASYIPYFRRFHLVLGISFFTIGSILTYFGAENTAGIFLIVYPILAYVYFIVSGSKYTKEISKKSSKVGVAILLITLFFVLGLLGFGFKENTLKIESENIEFQGSYGEKLLKSTILSVELVHKLPKITLKTNGFALGTIKKGYFKTNEGEIVKLILNADQSPLLLFTKTNGQKIYFTAKEKSSFEVMDELEKKLPDLNYR
ncbi:MAG: DUF3784 domain-containing protein [Crocinitomicaceae bacterium]